MDRPTSRHVPAAPTQAQEAQGIARGTAPEATSVVAPAIPPRPATETEAVWETIAEASEDGVWKDVEETATPAARPSSQRRSLPRTYGHCYQRHTRVRDMPRLRKLGLCHTCRRHKPRCASFWTYLPRRFVTPEEWRIVLNDWQTRYLHTCPHCWISRHMTTILESQLDSQLQGLNAIREGLDRVLAESARAKQVAAHASCQSELDMADQLRDRIALTIGAVRDLLIQMVHQITGDEENDE